MQAYVRQRHQESELAMRYTAEDFQTDGPDRTFGCETEGTPPAEPAKEPSELRDEFPDCGTRGRDDLAERQSSIAAVVSTKILPRLALLHLEVPRVGNAVVLRLGAEDISRFAQLVLRPDTQVAEDQVFELIGRGVSTEQVFIELFEPVARRLGQMWDNDACDFLDVTRGMGRLHRFLATMECNTGAPALLARRSILMSTMPGEQQHSFGIAMVEKLLEAWGWRVRGERPASLDQILDIVENNWIAVIGLSVSRTNGLENLARSISKIRGHSQNAAIGVMVGGPALSDQPGLAATVGADATAKNGSLAVLAAEKLFYFEAHRRSKILR